MEDIGENCHATRCRQRCPAKAPLRQAIPVSCSPAKRFFSAPAVPPLESSALLTQGVRGLSKKHRSLTATLPPAFSPSRAEMKKKSLLWAATIRIPSAPPPLPHTPSTKAIPATSPTHSPPPLVLLCALTIIL